MTLANKILSDDKVWETLSGALIGKTTRTSSKFVNFNCPVCVLRGQSRPDTKKRCSVAYDATGIGIHCFNCGFKSRFKRGELLSKGMEQFLLSLGVPEKRVNELYFWAFQIREIFKSTDIEQTVSNDFTPTYFPPVSLPDGAKPLLTWAEEGCTEQDFIDVVEYLFSRGEDIQNATTYYWTPDKKNDFNRRLIVPFYYEGNIVGWTGRACDDTKPKYFNKNQPGYIFNCDIMKENRKYLIIAEGIFDALALDCIAVQSNSIPEKQLKWINSSHQTKILVPDKDNPGKELIKIALEQDWDVALPHESRFWHMKIKDIADAVQTYGRLYTLRSVILSVTSDKGKIKIYMNK